MSSVTEGNLGLNYGWAYGESGWNSGMDENIVKLGFESRKRVIGIVSSPPLSPSNGDAYIIGISPTGLFSGKFANIAIYDRNSWIFIVPKSQEVVFNTSDGCDYIYNNGWSLKLEAEVSSYIKIKDFTFSTGYTITDQKQCLLNITDNHYYQWNGTLPKVVSAGSTPSTAGGVGAGAWSDKTDLMLRGELKDRSHFNVLDYGAIPIKNPDEFNSSYFTSAFPGSDSTASIKSALIAVQTAGKSQGGFPYSKKAPVLDLQGKTFIVTGDNALGAQLDSGFSYYYKIINGQILWNRGTSDNLFGGFTHTNCYKFDLENLNIISSGNNDSTSGIIFKMGDTGVNPLVGGCLFTNVNISCGSYATTTYNCCKYVFKIAGNTLGDRFTMLGGNIEGFVNLYESSNPESVSFDFIDTSIITPRPSAILFNHTTTWSGGMNIHGCDLITLGGNSTLFKSSNPSSGFAMPSVDIRSRVEMRGTGNIFFDVEHGVYNVYGMNQLAGSGSGSISVKLGAAASVTYENCTLAQKFDLGAFGTSANELRRVYVRNCSVELGYPIVTYGSFGSDYRALNASGRYSGVMKFYNCSRTTNGVWGNGYSRSEDPISKCRIGYRDGSGYIHLAPPETQVNVQVRLPSNVFITSALVHCVAQASPATYVGLYLNNTLVEKVAISSTANIKTELVPSNKWGAYCIGECLVSAKILDSSSVPLSTQSGPVAFVDLTYRPISQVYEYSTEDVGLR